MKKYKTIIVKVSKIKIQESWIIYILFLKENELTSDMNFMFIINKTIKVPKMVIGLTKELFFWIL